jgi:hypothetical protein
MPAPDRIVQEVNDMAYPVMESGRELTYEDYVRLPDDGKRHKIHGSSAYRCGAEGGLGIEG